VLATITKPRMNLERRKLFEAEGLTNGDFEGNKKKEHTSKRRKGKGRIQGKGPACRKGAGGILSLRK